jgi:hypothetical protein
VTGLTNGTSYTFKVLATNGTDGPASGASNAVTPRTVPGQPTGVTGTAGDASATVKWVAPTSTGGSAITGYSVRVFSGTTLVKTVPVGNVLTTSVTGLTNGTAYTFDVAATNAAGTGTPSAASAAATPAAAPVNTPPGAPTIGTATAGVTQATVTWTAPAAKGTPTMTGYKVQAFAGTSTTASSTTAVAGATSTSGTVTGLTAGTSYTFKVLATNGTQDSTPSAASNAVTPIAALAVTGRAPGVNGTSVPVANNITATFNRAVTGVGTGTFQVKNPAGTVIAGAVTQSTTVANQWVLNPTASLANDTKYTVTLTGGATAIRDTAGNPLTTLSWSFTTGPAPTVTPKSPVSGATSVSRTADVTATFSEAVQAVSGTTVTLKNATTGAAITAVVSYNATTHVVTLNPSATLAANTKFTVTVTGGAAAIRDTAGNPLATTPPTTWSFTTGTV